MRKTTTAICLAVLTFPPAAAPQQSPPLAEAEIIRQLTSDVPDEWLGGVGRSLGVPPDERSPALLTAMIEALEREVEWDQQQTGPGHPSFDDRGEGFSEGSAILASELAATGDPRTLPTLAWHSYNNGPVAQTLFAFGHEAVPHLLAVATSPMASGGVAGPPLTILASIVSAHGPGSHEKEIAEAAALHLYGPPEHYRSAWSSLDHLASLLQAIGLASVLRTPELLDRLEALAAMSPEEVEQATGYPGAEIRHCVLYALGETEKGDLLCAMPTWWAQLGLPG